MNRINQMIDMYATIAALAFFNAVSCVRDGFIEQSTAFTNQMLDARGQLTTWIKISQAIRGWKL